MGVVWKRINDTGKNWRHVYKVCDLFEVDYYHNFYILHLNPLMKDLLLSASFARYVLGLFLTRDCARHFFVLVLMSSSFFACHFIKLVTYLSFTVSHVLHMRRTYILKMYFHRNLCQIFMCFWLCICSGNGVSCLVFFTRL